MFMWLAGEVLCAGNMNIIFVKENGGLILIGS